MSPDKRKYLRKIGYTDAQIKALEAEEAATKAKSSPLAEMVYKMVVDGKPAGDGGRIGQMVREKLTKDSAPAASPTASPFVNRLIAGQPLG